MSQFSYSFAPGFYLVFSFLVMFSVRIVEQSCEFRFNNCICFDFYFVSAYLFLSVKFGNNIICYRHKKKNQTVKR